MKAKGTASPARKTTTDQGLTDDQGQFNLVHSHMRARTKQGNAWLKNYRVLQKVSLCLWRIGVVTAAFLVALHLEHNRTT